MADRAVPLNPAALALAVLLLALVAAPMLAVAARATGFALAPADWAAVRFTLVQAALSALVSTVLAIPVASALVRRRFPGRSLLITLMGAPFLLPAIAAVLGLLVVFGRSGVLNDMARFLGLPPFSIFGLHGVVLAHVFLNLPLATRMILQGWQAIPSERFRLAASLGFSAADTARHLERPMLREVVPGTALVIFVICLSSFAVALTLGGGPRATTIELAIYQAVRFDFDLGRAAMLAALQVGLSGLALLLAWKLVRTAGFGTGLDRPLQPMPSGRWQGTFDVGIIALAAAFLLLPLGAVVLRGLPGLTQLPPSVFAAALRSVAVALASTAITVPTALVLVMAVAARTRGHWMLEMAAVLPLAASGLVLGTGLFLIIQPFAPPSALSLPVTVLVNAALSLPFVYRLLLPQARALVADYVPLADSLGMSGWPRWRWMILPRLARPLGFGAGIVSALSMGDLGVITLFAGEGRVTLPLMVQQLMGAFRTDAAASAALLLVALSFLLFWLFDWGGRRAAS